MFFQISYVIYFRFIFNLFILFRKKFSKLFGNENRNNIKTSSYASLLIYKIVCKYIK